jgi:hypothetical protein
MKKFLTISLFLLLSELLCGQSKHIFIKNNNSFINVNSKYDYEDFKNIIMNETLDKDIIFNKAKSSKNFFLLRSTFKKDININGSKGGNLFSSYGCSIPNALFIDSKVDSVAFDSCTIHGNLIVKYCNIEHDFVINSDSIRNLYISDSNTIKGDLFVKFSFITGNSYISGDLGRNIDFTDLRIGSEAELDITGIRPSSGKIDIQLNNSSIDRIKMNYEKLHLVFRKETPSEIKNSIYLDLLDNFKKRGYNHSYELLDLEYQDLKYSNNVIKKYWLKCWSNYGYARWYIFIWTFGLIIFFSLVNFNLYEKLNTEVYKLKNFPPSLTGDPKITSNLKKLYSSFVYTSALFFSFRINFEYLHYNNKKYLLWFLIINCIGLICLAYLVNFVISS